MAVARQAVAVALQVVEVDPQVVAVLPARVHCHQQRIENLMLLIGMPLV